MDAKYLNKILNYFISSVWFANGFFCKVLNFVPRHQQIVTRILGEEHAFILTKIIGFSEIGMAVWILSGIKTRFNAVTQMGIIALMNLLEFILAPDLLLWGKLNSLFALMFIFLIGWNEFVLNKKMLNEYA